MIKNKVLEHLFGLMVDLMQVNGKMENNMDKENILHQMELLK